jgi:ketosteroid isomerase-like protein
MGDADALTRLLHAIDRLDWAAARACFADEVATDYTSLWGGEPETIPADDLISRWQEFTATLAATQHVTGPIVIRDGHAETHVVAYHWLADGDVWTVHGHYIARIAGGRIAELNLQTFYAGGHDGLPNLTARRPEV